MPRILAIAAFAVLAVSGIACADDAYPEPLRIVLARTGRSALLLWNATPYVAAIARARSDPKTANDRLERGALRAIAEKFPLVRNATSIDVRVLYDKTGDVSPIYGAATFAGVERYAIVHVDGSRAHGGFGSLATLRDRDPIPPWVSFTVVGTLPPH